MSVDPKLQYRPRTPTTLTPSPKPSTKIKIQYKPLTTTTTSVKSSSVSVDPKLQYRPRTNTTQTPSPKPSTKIKIQYKPLTTTTTSVTPSKLTKANSKIIFKARKPAKRITPKLGINLTYENSKKKSSIKPKDNRLRGGGGGQGENPNQIAGSYNPNSQTPTLLHSHPTLTDHPTGFHRSKTKSRANVKEQFAYRLFFHDCGLGGTGAFYRVREELGFGFNSEPLHNLLFDVCLNLDSLIGDPAECCKVEKPFGFEVFTCKRSSTSNQIYGIYRRRRNSDMCEVRNTVMRRNTKGDPNPNQ